MRKINKLKVNVNDFIEERIQASYEKVLSTEKYKKLAKRYYELFPKIECIVNNAELTEEYKEAETEIYMLQIEEAYKTEFKDSINIFLNT